MIPPRLHAAIQCVIRETRDFNERKQQLSCRVCRYKDPLDIKLHDPDCSIYELHGAWEDAVRPPQTPASKRLQELEPRDETWAVTVARDGEVVVTIASSSLSGRDLLPGDETAIRRAANHLLAFICDPNREAVPAEEEKEKAVDEVRDARGHQEDGDRTERAGAREEGAGAANVGQVPAGGGTAGRRETGNSGSSRRASVSGDSASEAVREVEATWTGREPPADFRVHLKAVECCQDPTATDGFQGSRFVSIGAVAIAAMGPDARDAMDLAIARFDAHLDRLREGGMQPTDRVYSFAYWLFRWSGIVTGVNLKAPENPWSRDGESA
jgi:hypothetical protein